MLSLSLPFANGEAEAADADGFAPNAFIRIDHTGKITLIMPQVEMGQGTYTSISMILAEELDADWSLVRVEHAPADEKLYANPDLGFQVTGDSTSIRAFWQPLRLAGAATRACLIEAAAHRWGVPIAECRTENSKIIHDQSGRTLDYGALVGRAAAVTPPKAPPLKEASAFRLIGRSLKRLDTPDKVNGKATYGIDVLPPGVKFATHAASPVLGGTVAHVDDRRAKAVPGVRQIVVLNDLVAVVGDHMWAAKCGLAALDITWNDGPNAEVSSELIWSRLRSASLRDGAVANEGGDVKKAFGSNGKASSEVVTAAFEMPLLAHACMEPLNCTVHVTPTSAEAWIGTQVMERVHAAVAKAAGLPESQVTVHNHLLGGGLRSKAGAGHGVHRCTHRQAGRGTCQGGVDPRGRHPSRFLSTGLPRPPLGALGGRPHRRLEAQSVRLVRECSISAPRFPEGDRS